MIFVRNNEWMILVLVGKNIFSACMEESNTHPAACRPPPQRRLVVKNPQMVNDLRDMTLLVF